MELAPKSCFLWIKLFHSPFLPTGSHATATLMLQAPGLKPHQLCADVWGHTSATARRGWQDFNWCLPCSQHEIPAQVIWSGVLTVSASKVRPNRLISHIQHSLPKVCPRSPVFLWQLTQTVNASSSRGDCDFWPPPHPGQSSSLPKGAECCAFSKWQHVQYLTHQNMMYYDKSSSYHRHRLDFHWTKSSTLF